MSGPEMLRSNGGFANGQFELQARMDQTHRSCPCGAVYHRTEGMAPARQCSSFECAVCGQTLESWNTAWVPTYRLIAGPVRQDR